MDPLRFKEKKNQNTWSTEQLRFGYLETKQEKKKKEKDSNGLKPPDPFQSGKNSIKHRK